MATRTEKRPEMSGNSALGSTAIITIHGGAAPGANTNIGWTDALGASVTTFKVGANASAIRVTCCFTTTTKFDLRVTDGTTAYSQHLFANADCTASNVYSCVFGVRRYSTQNADTELSYGFRVQTDSIIQTLNVEEIYGGVD